MRRFLVNVFSLSIALLVTATLSLAGRGHMVGAGARMAMQSAAPNGLSLPFVENRGQMDPRVAFYAHSGAGTVFVTHDGSLVQALPPAQHLHGARQTAWALVERPVGGVAAPAAGPAAVTQVSMLGSGNTAHGVVRLPTYTSVRLSTPWQGIDMAVRVQSAGVERVFTLAPGADAGAILMDVKGASMLSIQQGGLVAMTGLGPVRYSRPDAYQFVHGLRREVPVSYRVEGLRYGFALGAHDVSTPVVIDPLIQATYIAGGDEDTLTGMYVDGDNAVYVAGYTLADTFPGTDGGAVASPTEGIDMFVAKLSHDLKTLEQATYLVQLVPYNGQFLLGPTPSVSVGRNPVNGNVYVVGSTTGDLPGSASGALSTFTAPAGSYSGDSFEAFAAELNPGLTTLIQSTFVGGTGESVASDMGFSAAGDLYVTGWTDSNDLPAVSGGAQTTVDSTAGSAFVSELAANLQSFVQTSFYGAGVEKGTVHLGLDGAGDVYLAGTTTSSSLTDTSGGAQSAMQGTSNAFVCKLSGDLTSIAQATYLGGSGDDILSALSLDGSGNVYLAGSTSSMDFPGTVGGAVASNPAPATTESAFISKLNGGLTGIVQSTYLGSNLDLTEYTLGIDANGDVFFAGAAFPPVPAIGGGFQAVGAVDETGFVSKFNSGLTSVEQSSYTSQPNDLILNIPVAIGFDASGDVYVGGSGLTQGTTGGAEASIPGVTGEDVGGSGAGYVMAMSPDLKAGPVKLVMTPQQATLSGVFFSFPFMLQNESTTQEATNLVLTIQMPAGVSLLDVANEDIVMNCGTSGQTVTCPLALLVPGQSTLITADFHGSDGLSGELTGKVLLSADQSLAVGSTSALDVNLTIGGGSGSGSNGGGGGGGGGDTSLLETMLLIGFVCRRFLHSRQVR